MHAEGIHRVSSRIILGLALLALLTVLSGYAQPPHTPELDEGAAGHIFQISVVLLVPLLLLFAATSDWKRPWRSARLLVFPAAALIMAFAALYYLEHYYLRP